MLSFDCQYVRARLSSFANGDLAPDLRQRVAKHLDDCESCSHEYERYRKMVRTLRMDMPVIGNPNSDNLKRIWATIEQEIPTRSKTSWPTFTPQSFVLGVFLTFIFIVPLVLGQVNTSINLPAKPAPHVAEFIVTPAKPQSNHGDLTLPDNNLQLSKTSDWRLILNNTPESLSSVQTER